MECGEAEIKLSVVSFQLLARRGHAIDGRLHNPRGEVDFVTMLAA
jgi:hypothetical protein